MSLQFVKVNNITEGKMNNTMTKQCRICNSKCKKSFSAQVLSKYNADYYLCSECQHLFIADPFWLEEAYNESICSSDTGIMVRNLRIRNIVAASLFILGHSEKTIADFGGGYGIFVRLMRDLGFDCYWDDPHSTNLLARGFEYTDSGLDGVDYVSLFECIEHFSNPLAEFSKYFEISGNLILSTELATFPPEKPKDWWYYALDDGQHISFYTRETLKKIADKFNKNYYHFGGLHYFFDDPILKKTLIILEKTLKSKSKVAKVMKKISKELEPKFWKDHEYILRNNKSCSDIKMTDT